MDESIIGESVINALYRRASIFSKVAKVVDGHGTAAILKNNILRYFIVDFCKTEKVTRCEDVFVIFER